MIFITLPHQVRPSWTLGTCVCSPCVFSSWSSPITCQCLCGCRWRWAVLSCRAPHPSPTSSHPTPTALSPSRSKATSWVTSTGEQVEQLIATSRHKKSRINTLLFSRPVSYSVNQQHPGQILVQAQVIPLALELSPTLLVLHPDTSLLAQSAYRSSVTLRNQRNHAAEFTWRPVVTEDGLLFSIRPATGARL